MRAAVISASLVALGTVAASETINRNPSILDGSPPLVVRDHDRANYCYRIEFGVRIDQDATCADTWPEFGYKPDGSIWYELGTLNSMPVANRPAHVGAHEEYYTGGSGDGCPGDAPRSAAITLQEGTAFTELFAAVEEDPPCHYRIILQAPAGYFDPPAPVSRARKDPHFHFAHGGRADIRGEDGAIYNLLSAKNVSMNVQFEKADFKWAHRTVHGTKMQTAYWVVRTQRGKLLKVEFAAEKSAKGGGKALISLDEDEPMAMLVASKDGYKTYTLDNVKIEVTNKGIVVKTERWSMAATISPFPFPALNAGKLLLDVSVTALYDADKDVVAPHGIFGQAYDGDDVAVVGRMDEHSGVESTTSAQGEGAIEGVIGDYKLTNKFGVGFKYSRFDSTSAKPRDVSALTGVKKPRVKQDSTADALEQE